MITKAILFIIAGKVEIVFYFPAKINMTTCSFTWRRKYFISKQGRKAERGERESLQKSSHFCHELLVSLILIFRFYWFSDGRRSTRFDWPLRGRMMTRPRFVASQSARHKHCWMSLNVEYDVWFESSIMEMRSELPLGRFITGAAESVFWCVAESFCALSVAPFGAL